MYRSTINSSTDSLSGMSNYSSDTIMTNSPGTGRTVGHLWEKLSNWVEKKVLVVAHKQGMGLNAVRERVEKCLEEHVGEKCPWSLTDDEAIKIIEQVRSDCAKIGRYARYVIYRNRIGIFPIDRLSEQLPKQSNGKDGSRIYY